jgi:hypothetical protein
MDVLHEADRRIQPHLRFRVRCTRDVHPLFLQNVVFVLLEADAVAVQDVAPQQSILIQQLRGRRAAEDRVPSDVDCDRFDA